MSDPFIGQIVMFSGNFAPRGWAFCDGQILPITSNQALFAIIGTTYGGDGRSNFGLPDLRARVAMHRGTGPGLTQKILGQMGGAETNTLTAGQMPYHNHTLYSPPPSNKEGDITSPLGTSLAVTDDRNYVDSPGAGTTGFAGDNQPVDNLPPYNTVSYIIALQGTFPSRS